MIPANRALTGPIFAATFPAKSVSLVRSSASHPLRQALSTAVSLIAAHAASGEHGKS
jgi:hypothetical protein